MVTPEAFQQQTRLVMGDERYERFCQALDEPSPVSIRLNPSRGFSVSESLPRVPWCEQGYYCAGRPAFTFDPLFHAGCYYVQEASSMFIDHVLRQHVRQPVAMLDLCAAPGGKSTAAIAALPEDSCLVSNEPIRQRSQILFENIQKWGYPNCFVTNNYPKDFRRAKLMFDVILCDVPCSGEGMFRKDPASIGEWSPQNVERCWRLQREIVAEAWHCLKEGGLLIYSTCTYNTKENEENVRWIQQELGAEVLPVETEAEWHITGSLLKDFDEAVYRFIPGYTEGEGLFMAVLRKNSLTPDPSPVGEGSGHLLPLKKLNGIKQFLKKLEAMKLYTPLSNWRGVGGEAVGGEALFPLTYTSAIAYLRGEALVLPPDTPRGQVCVTFMGQPLGLVKNIGNRANNLYPKEWRIKSTHIPKEYEAILRPAGSHPA